MHQPIMDSISNFDFPGEITGSVLFLEGANFTILETILTEGITRESK